MKKTFSAVLLVGIFTMTLMGYSTPSAAGVDINIGGNFGPPPPVVILEPPSVVVIPGTYVNFAPTIGVDILLAIMAIGIARMRDVGIEPMVTMGLGSALIVSGYLLLSIICRQITGIYPLAINAFLIGSLTQTGKPGRGKNTGTNTKIGIREEEVMARKDVKTIKVTVRVEEGTNGWSLDHNIDFCTGTLSFLKGDRT